MIWIAIALLAVAALAPLAVALDRRATARGPRDLAVELHRTQLAELDRDLAESRILPAEHATAVLEVQRRLLAAADAVEDGVRVGSRTPVLVVAVLVPMAAVGLYLVGGSPGMPSGTPDSREVRQQRAREEGALIGALRERLATMNPDTDQARQGFVLLGNVEEARGNDAAAVAAWRVVLRTRFDATLAVRTVDAAIRVEGGLSAGSEALLRRALAVAPADAPWREAVETRLREGPR